MAVHHEVITVKVCLYLLISWEKPTFSEFWITSIFGFSFFTWRWILFSSITLYSIDIHFYVCCSIRHLKTLWQRKKLLLLHNVFKAFQHKKCSFLSGEWTFKIFLNVVCCKIAAWGKGIIFYFVLRNDTVRHMRTCYDF